MGSTRYITQWSYGTIHNIWYLRCAHCSVTHHMSGFQKFRFNVFLQPSDNCLALIPSKYFPKVQCSGNQLLVKMTMFEQQLEICALIWIPSLFLSVFARCSLLGDTTTVQVVCVSVICLCLINIHQLSSLQPTHVHLVHNIWLIYFCFSRTSPHTSFSISFALMPK